MINASDDAVSSATAFLDAHLAHRLDSYASDRVPMLLTGNDCPKSYDGSHFFEASQLDDREHRDIPRCLACLNRVSIRKR